MGGLMDLLKIVDVPEPFQQGDRVRHVTGGPLMIVEFGWSNGQIGCKYWSTKRDEFVYVACRPGDVIGVTEADRVNS